MGTLMGTLGFEGRRSPRALAHRARPRVDPLRHTSQPVAFAELGIFETCLGVVASGRRSRTLRDPNTPHVATDQTGARRCYRDSCRLAVRLLPSTSWR